MTELQQVVFGLEKDLRKTRSKFESVVEFNDQLKHSLAIAQENLIVYRRDLAIARERIKLLELLDEAHAEDQLVIDKLKEELASLSFVASEKDQRICQLENNPGQTLVEVPENTVNLSLSEKFGNRPLVRAASI